MKETLTSSNDAEKTKSESAPSSSHCSNAFMVWMMHYAKCSDLADHIAICKQVQVVAIPCNGDRVYPSGYDRGELPKLISLGAEWHEQDGLMIPVVMLDDEDEQEDESTLQQWIDCGWQVVDAWDFF